MKKIFVILMTLVLAACSTQGVRTGEDSNSRHRAKLHTELAAAYYSQGQMAIALEEFTKATGLDSSYAPAYTGLGLVHAALKQDAKAESNFKRALQLEPENSEAHNNYGTFLCVRNRVDEAIGEFNQVIKLSPGKPLGLAALARAYALSGKRAEAEKLLAELQEISKQHYVSPTSVALIHAGLGHVDQTFVWLEKAEKGHDATLVRINVDPRFDRLRFDARFNDLVRRLGLPQ